MPQRSVCRQAPPQRTGPAPVSRPQSGARARRGALAWRDGLRAEQRACDALRAENWIILARRARTPAGEIDIVARCGELLAFVEVKARSTLALAAGSVSLRQQNRLRAAASILLATHPDWSCALLRFDVLVVDRTGTVRRIADAFRAESDVEAGD